MGISASDVTPLSTARANLSELAEEVKAGTEKIVTKNDESYIALIDARRLDYYHQLERERIHLLLIDEASKGRQILMPCASTSSRITCCSMRRLVARFTSSPSGISGNYRSTLKVIGDDRPTP